MKKISLVSFLFALFFILPGTVSAQTTLDQGDIAFVGLYMDGLSTAGDGFTFILLKSVEADTVIYFTDEGWDATNTTWYGNSNDAHFSWTAPSGGSLIGTIVHIENITATTYSTTSGTVSATLNGIWNLSSSGDQMLAYQSGSGVRPALPVFLAAIDADYYTGSTYDGLNGWGSSYYNQNYCSDLPSGLTNGVDCVAMVNASQPTEYDNYKYNGTLTGTASAVRAAINNYSNWTRNDDGSLDISVSAYAIPNITDDSNPEIDIRGNGNSITDGDMTPSSNDHTDFGTTPVCNTTIVRTFTIQNTGTAVLNISSVNISGTDAADFSVTASPAASVAAAGSTTFQVTFNPSASGARNAVITVNSDDSDEAAYDFAVTGNGTNMTITPASQTNVSCYGGLNGAASANAATGGTAPYSYNWTPGNPAGDGTLSVTGLTAGTWTVTATDANGCTASTQFNLTQPEELRLTIASQTNVSVNGGSDGAASVNTATGGAGGYSYNWTPGNPAGDGSVSVTGLIAGTWTCTVTDENSCTTFKNITIIEPPAVSSADTSSVTAGSAVLGGTVTADGGGTVTVRGVVYSITNATPAIGEPGVFQDANGSGTGIFSKTISGLDPNKTYYFRAYAVNGAGTTYGGIKNFTTLKGTPAVSVWPDASDITYGQALSASTLTGGSASVAGIFTFTAPETTLNAGAIQSVDMTFTPDSEDYNTVAGTVTINVNTAELTATADDKTRNFGDANPEFTMMYEGFVNGDDSDDLDTKPTASSEAVITSQAGDYDITVSGGSDNNYTFKYVKGTLTINAIIPVLNTAAVIGITSKSAKSGGSITSDGGDSIATKGVCYSENEDPDTDDLCVNSNAISNSFTAVLTELTPETLYHVRAYATNSAGTAYGDQVNFTTSELGMLIPASELPLGAVVYDDTWEWNTNPLEWRVVHTNYGGVESVTLSSTSGIGGRAFNSVWDNNWSAASLRTWLNSGFIADFSPAFLDSLQVTDVPWVNTATGGVETDYVFISSRTELGGMAQLGDGTVFDWFSDQATATARRADVASGVDVYWTRTGALGEYEGIWSDISAYYITLPDGNFVSGAWVTDAFDVIPAVNISADTMFELIEGKYRLFIATPEVTWNAAYITYGQALGESSLSGSTAKYEGVDVAGIFSFDDPDEVLNAGTNENISVTFTPNDLATYRVVTGLVTVNVNKAIPVITWDDPADMVYGTALDATQLNATADVTGTFVYLPSEGTVLNAGLMQTLGVEFTPSDTANYEIATAQVMINVGTVELTATADDKERNYGEANPEFTITYSGFVNGDDEDDIDTKPEASTLVDELSPVGPYDITVSGGSDDNYTFKYVSGKLTINAKAPEITTGVAGNITTRKADAGAIITSDGGSTITAKGICYNTTGIPNITDICVNDLSVDMSFVLQFTDLMPATLYYYRAYATNSVETGYGETLSFTTKTAIEITSGQSFVINENTSAATLAGTVLVTGDIFGVSLFSIVAGNSTGAFSINNNGKIYVADMSKLDFEKISSFLLTILVSDDENSDSKTIEIVLNNLNDNSPVLSDKSFTISEFADVGTVAGIIIATDADGTLNPITYTIVSGNEDGVFTLGVDTGIITITDNSTIDYETTPQYVLTIKASDTNNETEATITINVSDESGLCEDPEKITELPYTHKGSTTGRSSDITSYGTGCGAGETTEYVSPDYIYSHDMKTGDKVEITLTPAEGFDGVLVVTGTCGDNEACAAYANDVSVSAVETIIYEATEDRTIFIVVEGTDGTSGDYTLEVKEWVDEPDDDVIIDEDTAIVDDDIVIDEDTEIINEDNEIADEDASDTDQSDTDQSDTDLDSVEKEVFELGGSGCGCNIVF
ncbi:MAG TPA: MBG domain-containing protein [bacterium]|nr:MBG domain-containing protein [bacterium]